jgi:hypothetical protein
LSAIGPRPTLQHGAIAERKTGKGCLTDSEDAPHQFTQDFQRPPALRRRPKRRDQTAENKDFRLLEATGLEPGTS